MAGMVQTFLHCCFGFKQVEDDDCLLVVHVSAVSVDFKIF